jgi:hypothetical protein
MSETHREQEAAVRSSASDVSADLNDVPARTPADSANVTREFALRLSADVRR